jgi:hypothetical protein
MDFWFEVLYWPSLQQLRAEEGIRRLIAKESFEEGFAPRYLRVCVSLQSYRLVGGLQGV